MLSSILGSQTQLLKDAVRRLADRRILPVTCFASDLYIVEFPKSGVTWLSFLMGNANALLAGDNQKVTFFNVNDFVADIHASRSLPPAPTTVPGFRCIKSHAAFTPSYKKVLYLVRDPREVMASYFHFLTELCEWRGTIDALVDHKEFGIHAWIAHVNGWLDGIGAGTSFALLRYEDLRADTVGELQRLYRLLGWSLTDNIAHVVVDRCAAERMRADERLCNGRHPRLGQFQFVRPSPFGTLRTPMSEALRNRIVEIARPTMLRIGYEP